MENLGPIHESYVVVWFMGAMTMMSYSIMPRHYDVLWKELLAGAPAAIFFVALSVHIQSELTKQHFDPPEADAEGDSD